MRENQVRSTRPRRLGAPGPRRRRIGIATKLRSALTTAMFTLVALAPLPAAAHAAYKDSSPADRSSVSSPPGSVWAEFTEPVSSSSTLEIYDPCGTRVDAGDSSVSGYRITVSMDGSHAGTYEARFSVVSTLDGHSTTGSFTFTSTGGNDCPGSGGGANRGGDGVAKHRTGSSSGSGGGSTEADSAGEVQAAGAPNPEGPRRKAGKKKPGGHGQHSGRKKERQRSGKDPARRPGTRPLAQRETVEPDLPLDWLLISFTISAAIGAVGGRVYASISRPRRKRG